MTDEYATLKTEQLERIKQRDTFLNLNIVAIGAVTAIAVQGERQASAWLVVPWLSAILGWAYLSNDDKVTAIARHVAASLPHTGAATWEAGEKGLLAPRIRHVVDFVVFVLSFVLPTPVAIALYSSRNTEAWPAVVLVIVIIEVCITACLFAVYTMSALRR